MSHYVICPCCGNKKHQLLRCQCGYIEKTANYQKHKKNENFEQQNWEISKQPRQETDLIPIGCGICSSCGEHTLLKIKVDNGSLINLCSRCIRNLTQPNDIKKQSNHKNKKTIHKKKKATRKKKKTGLPLAKFVQGGGVETNRRRH